MATTSFALRPSATVKKTHSLSGSRQTAIAFSPLSPCLPARQLQRSRKAVVVQASNTKPAIAEFAESIGLPTDEGLFGFKPFSELWVGRLAMIGFLSSVIGEVFTGKGALAQIGLVTPSPLLLAGMSLFFGTATAIATARTIYRATNKKMTAAELTRYRQFLGMQRERQNIAEEQAKLKQGFLGGSDFTAPDNLAVIERTKAEGTPADKVLNMADRSQAAGAEAEVKGMEIRKADGSAGPSMSLEAKADVLEQINFQDVDAAYARQIELENGRWAAIGFLISILVEASTGQGILSQLITEFKALNLLGPASGF